MERLEPLPDGRLRYRLKRPWRDGTTHVVFEPLDLLEKLAALVPAPKAHLVRYSGILAPAAKWRALIVPADATAESTSTTHVASGAEATEASVHSTDLLPLAEAVTPVEASPMDSPAARRARNYTWPELMKRVFEIDVLECPCCLGRMRILATIHPCRTTRQVPPL